ncbi:MAG: MFS transporter [Verrucomicrobia bacterium]|nr:MFS transporter [Verrucomicrobiota bacterium]
MALLAAILGWMFDGFEMGLFPLVARPALKELMGPSAGGQIGTWFSIIMAGFLVGAACGGIFFGWLGDRIGRVKAMAWSVLVYSIFTAVCGFVTAAWQLAILRFIASLGMGGEWALGVALIMEVWPRGSRPMLAGVIGASGNMGYLSVALVGFGLNSVVGWLGETLRSIGLPEAWVVALLANSGWRLLLFIGALPAFLTLFIIYFVPESQRWQHASQSGPKNRVSDVFKHGLARTTILATLLSAVALLGTWGSAQWIPAWADKLSHEMPNAKSFAQICMSAGAILCTLLAAFMAQATSRRWSYFGLCLLSLAACAYLFRAPIAYGNWFLLMTFVVGGLTASFYGWLPLYLPELFPTRVRATGQGFCYNFSRVLAAGGTLVSGQLLNHFHEDYAQMCAVISLIYAVGLGLIWFCPETKGKPLPE